MKKLLSILCLFLALHTNAQTPQAINYQGVARDNSGNVIATHLVAIRLSILSGSTTGSAVYVEKHTRTTDAFGLFSLQIGQGTVVSGLFSSISWGNNSYYLKVEIDPTGGINYQLAGVSQFAAVPYAMYATSSGSQTQGSTPGDLQYWNGNTWVVLHPGTSGQILTLNGNNMPVWQNAPSYSTNLPLLTTTSVSSILNTTAISGGNITSDGGSVVSERGVCWSIGSTPTISDNKTSDGVGGGSFISNINNLLGSTNYNLRAYATNNSGTGYGMTLSFTTTPPVLPVLTTTTISNITSATAQCGGNISTNGGALITARGVCWSTSSNPTITSNKTTDSIGSGVFISNVTGLLPGKTYYIRAYATNSVGTIYGNELSFTTPSVLPILNTTTVSSITSTNALIGGNISYNGGASITDRGICWSTFPNTACYSSTNSGSGTGSFTGSLTHLAGGTTYYVKAYATNSAGTAYGNELSFTTLPPTLATITTTNVSSVASTIALSGGNISSDGGAYITSRGVCWSTSVNPTIANSKTIDAGTGFTSLINGLTLGTTYYVRAYATNSVGTTYGNQLSFTTMTQIGIGDSYQGGKIAYFLQPGDPGYIPGQIRGLIAAPSDQSTSAIWGCNNNNIAGADGIAIGTGNQNTIDIMAGCSTAGIAARLCGDLVIGGYSDWYLPSKDELNKFFINREVIGGYNFLYYWSSSEYDNSYAWSQYWDYQTESNKTNMNSVRAFRSFGPSVVATTAVTSIETTSVVSGGNISSDGGETVTARGVCWNTSANPTIALSTKTSNGSGTGSFTSSITGLTAGTTYYIRAYATNSLGTSYGNEVSFTTLIVLPTITTTAATDITSTTASSGGNITYNGGATITARGICYSTTTNPTIADSIIDGGAGTGSFISNLTGLSMGTTYYIRAYATNSLGTAYGNELSVTTLTVLPTITTTDATNITFSTALSGGNVTSSGGATITSRGICYSYTNTNPTTANSIILSGTGTGAFVSNLSGLIAGKTYYVRAYATNSVGTAYGNLISFTTLTVIPIITTTTTTAITSTTATSGGNISNDGGATVTVRGICYSTTPNPTTGNIYVLSGSGTGSFTSNLTGLTIGTTYYIRAFAINSVGTAYGNEVSFTTLAVLPTITTSVATSITSSTASSGGNVTNSGGAIITAKGVCWSTSSNPSTALSTKTSDSSGMGVFNSSITGLTAATIYYVRAYAINSIGTAYGNEVIFTTLAVLPTITTTTTSSITTTSAISGGNIIYNGGANITVSGICWSTSSNPTTTLSSKTTDGSLTGIYSSSITGLIPGTTYYARAYATNSVGTSYGNEESFTTLAALPTITTTAATAITSTTASSGGNITSDGGASVTARGICYSTTTNPTTANSIIAGGSGTGSFISNLTGLTSGTTYYVRAYATNTVGTSYGNQISFTAVAGLPTLTTTAASSVTTTTALSGGNVTSSGLAAVTARGICYSYTNTNPTTANGIILSGSGTGVFSSNLSGLIAGKIYYVRAYATNSVGTAYGNLISFTTLSLPIITTNSTSSITTTSAISGGNITYNGGTNIIVSGICWSTASNPTTALSTKTTDGSLTGIYSSSITGLIPGITYYTKAYATNSVGTSYGNEVSFTTLTALPTITTTTATAITSTTASSGGNITNDGGASVTARGICYSTTTNPTTANSIIAGGSGNGSFASNLTGLIMGTTYYIRAFATNSVGTAYGNEISFTTILQDFDGNIYDTIHIGTQVWLKQNLKTTHYKNGTAILNVTDSTAWQNNITGAYVWYNNNEATYKNTYGALYNWHAVNTGNLCPTGWHVPTDAEWTALTNYLGGEGIAGGKLKETGFAHWYGPNTAANNETGFTALPGGERANNGAFNYIGIFGNWWSSTERNTTYAWYRYMGFNSSNVNRMYYNKPYGFSVRCLRDF